MIFNAIPINTILYLFFELYMNKLLIIAKYLIFFVLLFHFHFLLSYNIPYLGHTLFRVKNSLKKAAREYMQL